MKTLQFVGYLFFRYYSKGRYNYSPYFRMLCSMTLLGFFHLLQIFILTNSVKKYINYSPGDDLWTKRLAVLWIMLPIGLVLYLLLPPKTLNTLKYEEEEIRRGYFYLITYIILSFALIFILAFLQTKKV